MTEPATSLGLRTTSVGWRDTAGHDGTGHQHHESRRPYRHADVVKDRQVVRLRGLISRVSEGADRLNHQSEAGDGQPRHEGAPRDSCRERWAGPGPPQQDRGQEQQNRSGDGEMSRGVGKAPPKRNHQCGRDQCEAKKQARRVLGVSEGADQAQMGPRWG